MGFKPLIIFVIFVLLSIIYLLILAAKNSKKISKDMNLDDNRQDLYQERLNKL